MKRLFAFGCSFTHHTWPMWPNFFIGNFDQVLNFGRGGAGNRYIFHSILEGINEFKITPDDTVVVMWSSYYRRDVIDNNLAWQLRGGVANYMSPEEIDLAWNLADSVIQTWDYMYTISEILTSKNIKFTFTSMEPMANKFIPYYLKSFSVSNIFCQDLTSYTSQKFLTIGTRPWNTENNEGRKPDGHPKVIVSYNFAKDIIGSKIGVSIDESVEIKSKQLHNILDRKIINLVSAGHLNRQNITSAGSSQVCTGCPDYLDQYIDLANTFKDI